MFLNIMAGIKKKVSFRTDYTHKKIYKQNFCRKQTEITKKNLALLADLRITFNENAEGKILNARLIVY